jgi:PAS domain S-box-containing protein
MREDLLELATEAIIVRGLGDGRIRYWNAGAEALYGWNRDEISDQDLHALLSTEFPESRQAAEVSLLQTGSWEGNLVQRTRDGSEIVVACRKALNSERDAVLEVNRDVTAQLHAEAVLRESEKMAAMGRLAGVIAHEINNPLTAVTNLLYLLQHHMTLDDEARRYVDQAAKELARVSQISRQTLSFYRETSEPVPVRVHELLDDVIGLQSRALESGRIAVERQYLPASPVIGFPVELRQVVLNLVSNAIQAMPQGGKLRLHVHEATDWRTGGRGPALSVLDTGTGIRREDAKRLFEPFFSTKASKGTGLGLWISRDILRRYDGRITYRSYHRAGQCVTCFRVFLPGNQTHAAAGQSAPRAESLLAKSR